MRFISRSTFVALLAVLAMSAVAVSSASAAGCEETGGRRCIWKVNGAKLETGKTAEVNVKASKGFVFKAKAGGSELKWTCTKLAAQKGATIIGGWPGTAKVNLTFKECTVQTPKGCRLKGESLQLERVVAELVEGAGASKGRVDTLLGTGGESMFTAYFESGCPPWGQTISPQGNILGEASPQQEEREQTHLIFGSAVSNKYKVRGSTVEREAGLKYGGEPFTISGEAELELTSKEKFGTY